MEMVEGIHVEDIFQPVSLVVVVVVVVNYCSTSLIGTKGLLSDIVLR